MDTQQAQQLAAEAEALSENLMAAFNKALNANRTQEAVRICDISWRAIRRWQRRYDAAAALDICDECGSEICDCIPPAAMAALLERIDADPHGHNDLSGLSLPY